MQLQRFFLIYFNFKESYEYFKIVNRLYNIFKYITRFKIKIQKKAYVID